MFSMFKLCIWYQFSNVARATSYGVLCAYMHNKIKSMTTKSFSVGYGEKRRSDFLTSLYHILQTKCIVLGFRQFNYHPYFGLSSFFYTLNVRSLKTAISGSWAMLPPFTVHLYRWMCKNFNGFCNNCKI